MLARRVHGIELREPPTRLVASVRIKSHPSQLRHAIASAQDQVLDVIGAEGLAPAGPLFTRYHRLGPIAELEVGVPLAQTIRPHPTVVNSTLPGGPALHAVCLGSRAQLLQTVRALHDHLTSAGLTPNGGLWEYYLAEPLPGLDRCSVEFFLPVVGAHSNGKRPHRPEELATIEVRPETATRSLFARPGPRWEEDVYEIDLVTSTRAQETTGASRVATRHHDPEPDGSEPET